MRGEYPTTFLQHFSRAGSPPLARGILLYVSGYRRIHGITPACAGNTAKSTINSAFGRDHPRLRGEYLRELIPLSAYQGSPPLARGIRPNCYVMFSRPRITPACAGNTLLTTLRSSSVRDHPRLRGEYLNACSKLIPHWGSPPLARGILPYFNTCTTTCGITPACAGNTLVLF